jgi:RNA polymerase sigma-70 factor (ECF subfamily)
MGPDGNNTPSDRSLLRRIARGQEDAATRLYMRYADRLRRLAERQTGSELATRLDADDIVQSVFRTFFRRAGEGNYDIPPGEELWKLFLVIALNKIRTAGAYHRAAKRDVARTSGGRALEHAGIAPDETSRATLRLVIDELLDSQPASHRLMVELRIEGYEVAEIAQRTGRSKRSVERILQDFRTLLTETIRKDQ